MYRAYWNMEFDPFSKEIDMKKLFKTNDFNEALTRLEFLNTMKGIGLFTGNPGSGKTYAIKYFLDNLNPNLYKVVYLPLTTISVMDFYQALAICLGLETGRSKTKLFFDIQNYIKQLVQEQKKNLVIAIDEAQLLSKEILTDLKILFNFDMDSKNMATLILIGLPVINHTLSKRIFEDLNQRIVMKYDFAGIAESDVRLYITDRLNLANANCNIFDDNSIVALASACNGSLRKLNLIITRALTIGATIKVQTINSDIIMKAVNDINLI